MAPSSAALSCGESRQWPASPLPQSPPRSNPIAENFWHKPTKPTGPMAEFVGAIAALPSKTVTSYYIQKVYSAAGAGCARDLLGLTKTSPASNQIGRAH